MYGIIGRKLGMTRIFSIDGIAIPVTVVHVLPNYITQIKKMKTDGYDAIQVTTGYKKLSKLTKPEIGHFLKSGIKSGRGLWEFRINYNAQYYKEFTVGQMIDVSLFINIKLVDVTGCSKGKGFAGTIKRWNFSSQDATHGNSLSHRAPGSIGQNQTPGRVFKGKKMAGHLGNTRITIQNLCVVRINTGRNLLLIKGATPGTIGGDLFIRPAIKYKI